MWLTKILHRILRGNRDAQSGGGCFLLLVSQTDWAADRLTLLGSVFSVWHYRIFLKQIRYLNTLFPFFYKSLYLYLWPVCHLTKNLKIANIQHLKCLWKQVINGLKTGKLPRVQSEFRREWKRWWKVTEGVWLLPLCMSPGCYFWQGQHCNQPADRLNTRAAYCSSFLSSFLYFLHFVTVKPKHVTSKYINVKICLKSLKILAHPSLLLPFSYLTF